MKLPLYLKDVSPFKLTGIASLVFPQIWFKTLLLWYFLRRYKLYVAKNLVLSTLNSFFIEKYGFLLFTIAYFSYAALYVENRTTFRIHATQLMLKFFLITFAGILFHGGFSKYLLVESVNRMTGGHCEGGDHSLSMAKCHGIPHLAWVDGFDISSHYYFLLTLMIMLVNNLFISMQTPIDLESQEEALSPFTKRVKDVVHTFTVVLLLVWLFEFYVTSIFFHTAFERLLGLLGVPVALLCIYINDKIFSLDETQTGEVLLG